MGAAVAFGWRKDVRVGAGAMVANLHAVSNAKHETSHSYDFHLSLIVTGAKFVDPHFPLNHL